MAEWRDARAAAAELAGSGFRVQILEPAPPAVTGEPFADDPLAEPDGSGTLLSPFGAAPAGATTWVELVAERPEVADFAKQHWLGPWPRLAELPSSFAATRLGLHRVAAYVMSPARRQANGKIGLRYTTGGFGTPFFVSPDAPDVPVQVRAEGAELVVQRGTEVSAAPLSTLNAAGALVGVAPDVAWASQFDIPEPGGLDDDLAVDPAAADALADWYGFATSVLEELRAEEASVEASNPQLWPEHFDPAIEVGSDEAKQRASYGFSPGDAEGGSELPYLYVSAWYPDTLSDDPFWNSDTFGGAKLTYAELVAADDQRGRALEFFRAGRQRLAAG